VSLKPLHAHIGKKLVELRALDPKDHITRAIEHLERHMAEFEIICGDTMIIPPEPMV
jgi:hypothetical protein